jgi:pimeloyl-ACP methyl ester carboxylesterase
LLFARVGVGPEFVIATDFIKSTKAATLKKPTTTMTKDSLTDSPQRHITLRTLRRSDDGRTVTYAVTGDRNSGTPVLFFYAGGGNRRVLASLHAAAERASLFVICVNRPGTGGTSPPPSGSDPAARVAAVCDDAAAVLDELRVPAANLFFACAGTPFALAFACGRHASRLLPTGRGRAVGVAPYVQPADCSGAKPLHRFAARRCPRCIVSPLVGSVFRSVGASVASFPSSVVVSGMRKKLTAEEQKVFDENCSKEDFARDVAWMFEERRDVAADVAVLMSRSADVGIDYRKAGAACEVKILHGEHDAMTPIAASEWLVRQLSPPPSPPPPPATLTRLEGSHEGTLFLLHPEIVEAMEWLGKT